MPAYSNRIYKTVFNKWEIFHRDVRSIISVLQWYFSLLIFLKLKRLIFQFKSTLKSSFASFQCLWDKFPETWTRKINSAVFVSNQEAVFDMAVKYLLSSNLHQSKLGIKPLYFHWRSLVVGIIGCPSLIPWKAAHKQKSVLRI